MKRLWVAFSLFAVLVVLALLTIDDQKFRLATVAVLAMFAVRTWNHSRKLQGERDRHPNEGDEDE